jgi:hypothetical protein
MERTPKQQKRDEAMWQANRLAHAVETMRLTH